LIDNIGRVLLTFKIKVERGLSWGFFRRKLTFLRS
jgi:hypothetical protein